MTTISRFRIDTAPPIRRSDRTPEEDAAGVARLVATAYLEVRDGHRPVRCLARHVNPVVDEHLARVARQARPDGVQPVRVLRTLLTPCERGLDACVLATRSDRVVAVAMRLEVRDGRWRVTSLGMPDSHS